MFLQIPHPFHCTSWPWKLAFCPFCVAQKVPSSSWKLCWWFPLSFWLYLPFFPFSVLTCSTTHHYNAVSMYSQFNFLLESPFVTAHSVPKPWPNSETNFCPILDMKCSPWSKTPCPKYFWIYVQKQACC